MFLVDDRPEMIQRLVDTYPEFRLLYEEVYAICLDTERVMEMFSKELLELDRNTVQYMIDEMQDEIDAQKVQLQEKDIMLQERDVMLQEKEKELVAERERAEHEIASLREEIEKLKKR